MKYIIIIISITFLYSCTSNNANIEKKPKPGLISKDASKGVSITDFLSTFIANTREASYQDTCGDRSLI